MLQETTATTTAAAATTTTTNHQHDVVYFGVVNLVHDSKIIGAVDLWRCRGCNQLFCEDKRYGVTDLAPEVGLPKVYPDSKWVALICTRDNNSNWTLTQVKPGGVVTHACTPETKIELHVDASYNLEPGMFTSVGKHRLILLENFVNSAVDVQTGQKHVTTTDAYQALGKPFSFTPPLSATVIEPSKYNIFNLASVCFIATAVLGFFVTFTGQNLPSNILQIILGVGSLGLIAGAYSVWTRKTWGANLSLLVSAILLAVFSFGKLSTNSIVGVPDILLTSLLLVSVVTSYLARARMKSLIEKQWHPLDMPAYG